MSARPVLEEVVPAALAGERLDRFVSLLGDVSRAEAARWLGEGRVLLDGEVAVSGKVRVAAGQVVAVHRPDAVAVGPAADAQVAVVVVHADEAVVVVDKPPGLVVHPGPGHDQGTLVNGLLARFPDLAGVGEPSRPGIAHRLDKGTSGLLVVARTPDALASLSAQLARRTAGREYVALVRGVPESASGLVDAPIGRSAREPTRMAVSSSGRSARTRYHVDAEYTAPVAAARLTCRLETGRTHQIRVHLAAIGHPVVGDARYGGVVEAIACPRPFLHAARLSFDHPVSGERVTFSSPLPPDLQVVLDTLR